MFRMTYIIYDPEEKSIWDNITKKAERGYKEFLEYIENYPGCFSWPWMSPGLTKKESEFIENLHYRFFGLDYIVDSIGCAQADYIWYEDVKDRIIYDRNRCDIYR